MSRGADGTWFVDFHEPEAIPWVEHNAGNFCPMDIVENDGAITSAWASMLCPAVVMIMVSDVVIGAEY